MIVSVDETREPISSDKVRRLEEGGVVVHRYTSKDIVDANTWMLKQHWTAKLFNLHQLALYMHVSPIVHAARHAKRVLQAPPNFVWVIEDDVFVCGM